MGPEPAEQGQTEALIGQEEHVKSQQGRKYEQEAPRVYISSMNVWSSGNEQEYGSLFCSTVFL